MSSRRIINAIKLKVISDAVSVLNVTQAMDKALCALQSKAIGDAICKLTVISHM